MNNEQAIANAIQSIDAKLDVLRIAFLSLASLYEGAVRQNLILKFEADIQLLLDLGVSVANPEAYYEEIIRHASQLKELLVKLKDR